MARYFIGVSPTARREDPSSRYPTVLDRFVRQAIAQVISAQWGPHYYRHSYGFRPQHSAQQAVREVQAHIGAGYGWVVDMVLQAFFDRVNHDRLMARLESRCPDAQFFRLVNRYLKAGASVAGRIDATTMGVPVRELTRRTRGNTIGKIVAELRETLLGWKAYFGIGKVLSPLREIDKWVPRRLSCYLLKHDCGATGSIGASRRPSSTG